jgi:hypothetical protein
MVVQSVSIFISTIRGGQLRSVEGLWSGVGGRRHFFRPSPQTCPPRIVEVKIDVGSVAKGECLSTCPPRIVEKKIDSDSDPRGRTEPPQDGL